jgi:predicted nucleotidyltransferase
MGQALGHTADELGCSERTLRRYIGASLLRGRRVATRGIELSMEEADYLRNHWALLHALKGALRTERDIRLAVLFGSTALGEDQPDSDVDLLIGHRRSGSRPLAGVRSRLRHTLDKPVHLVSLEQARDAPSLLADVLKEGRPLVDRDGLWSHLNTEADDILARATKENRDVAANALNAVAEARARLL